MEGMSNVGGVNNSESASQSNSEGSGVNSDSSAQFNGQDLDTAMGGGMEQMGQDLQSGDSLKEGNAMNDLGAKIMEAVNKALEGILGKGGEEAGGGEAPAGGSSGGGAPAGGSGGAESGGGAEASSMIDEILKKLEEAGVITAEQADKLKQSLGAEGGAESGADSGMQQEEAVA